MRTGSNSKKVACKPVKKEDLRKRFSERKIKKKKEGPGSLPINEKENGKHP